MKIESRVGGRVYAKYRDLGDHDWGEVTVWAPGRRLVHWTEANAAVREKFADWRIMLDRFASLADA